MIAYHELSKDILSSVRTHGLKQGNEGDKRDPAITATDAFLNTLRPTQLIEAGIDRLANIYAYLPDGKHVIDIADGARKLPADIPHDTSQALITINVDANRCFVSDLDLYDKIKSLYTAHSEANARKLGEIYWQHLFLLKEYDGSFRRPELLITYDVSSEDISLPAEV